MRDGQRKNQKGRAMGGMIKGITREVMEKGRGIAIEKEGMIVGKVKLRKQGWRIVEGLRKGKHGGNAAEVRGMSGGKGKENMHTNARREI